MKRESRAGAVAGPVAVILRLVRFGKEIAKGDVLNEPLLMAVAPSAMAYCFVVVPMERVHLDPRTDPAKKVNLDRMTVVTKGRNGEPKVQALPIHPALRGLLLALRAARARHTCELPAMAAKEWWKFRRYHGLAHLRFHSTRATLATEFARANVPLQKAKEILGHKSESVHLAYLHLNAADVADELGAVDFSTRAKPASPDAP